MANIRVKSGRKADKKKGLKRRSQAERRAATSQKVIDGTIKLVIEQGVSKVTVSTVVKSTGVSWGAAQNLFGAKHDLLVHICKTAFQGVTDRLEALAIDRSASLEERVRLIMTEVRASYEEPALIAANAICEDPPSHPKAHAALEKLLRGTRKKMDGIWLGYFTDLGLSEDKVMVTRHFAQMVLAGVSKNSPLEDPLAYEWRIPSEAFATEAFELLVVGVVQYLRDS